MLESGRLCLSVVGYSVSSSVDFRICIAFPAERLLFVFFVSAQLFIPKLRRIKDWMFDFHYVFVY